MIPSDIIDSYIIPKSGLIFLYVSKKSNVYSVQNIINFPKIRDEGIKYSAINGNLDLFVKLIYPDFVIYPELIENILSGSHYKIIDYLLFKNQLNKEMKQVLFNESLGFAAIDYVKKLVFDPDIDIYDFEGYKLIWHYYNPEIAEIFLSEGLNS